ncbi:MAG: hypothetical protein E7266_02895 [Lachnospiraceae bacterium]|nr:hypothetical protein [Lachnospiraceae bacterium]
MPSGEYSDKVTGLHRVFSEGIFVSKKAVSFLMMPVISVALWGCGEKNKENITVGEHISEYVRTADNVSAAMMYPKYWLDMQKEPYKVIMSAHEIESWNQMYEAANDGNLYEFEGYDDENEPHIVGKGILLSLLSKEFNTKGPSLYDETGKLITEDLVNIINERRNLSAVKEENAIGYGYTVSRADIRAFPYEGLVTADKDSNYICEFQVSSILINEPVLILHESTDGKWYYIFSRFCSGWIKSDCIGVCHGYDEWKQAMEYTDFLVVTGDKIVLEKDAGNDDVSELTLYMGSKLELVKYEKYVVDGNKRVPYENYIVKIPVRDEKGFLKSTYGFVPVSRDVHMGYLAYTAENLINQMFKVNGNRYGWGGMYNARDCSQYILEVYSTFGFRFGRNSATQSEMPFETYDISKMNEDEKKKILDNVPTGSILYFPGHVMMYLGKTGEEYYVISATGRMMSADDGDDNAIYAHTTLITPLSVRRISKKTWLESLTVIKVIKME